MFGAKWKYDNNVLVCVCWICVPWFVNSVKDVRRVFLLWIGFLTEFIKWKLSHNNNSLRNFATRKQWILVFNWRTYFTCNIAWTVTSQKPCISEHEYSGVSCVPFGFKDWMPFDGFSSDISRLSSDIFGSQWIGHIWDDVIEPGIGVYFLN